MLEHQPLPPFSAYSGSRSPKILFLGEAWGRSESECKLPFSGESGKEFWRMLGEASCREDMKALHAEAEAMHQYGLAWIRKREAWMHAVGIGFTNVLNLQPPGNKIESLCVARTDLPEKGKGYSQSAIVRGKYLRPEFLPELDRLEKELAELKPNLIVALGNTACWALLDATNIGGIRGSVTMASALGSRTKVLPTYHPAGVLYNWSWRPIVVADLMKAFREGEFPEIRRPKRKILVSPTLQEVEEWTARVLNNPPKLLAPDIETRARQITCIGFATSRDSAICIPFVDTGKANGSYWPSFSQELAAWNCVGALLESPIPKVGQNFLYDLQYITGMGFVPKACEQDTMLLHHSLFPELLKGLGFLGSIYTEEASWKLMRRQRPDTEKKDE